MELDGGFVFAEEEFGDVFHFGPVWGSVFA